MAFEKTFDEILNGILTDFQNIFPGVDVSQGSLAYMKAAGYASALWGLYRYQEWISRQIFPDAADPEQMEHHAWVRGLARKPGEDDAALLARLLDYIRRPPAGGNRYDYVKWALSITNVAAAYCIPLAQGDGTVDVVIVADPDTGSEIPGQALLDEVKDYIDTVRPVTAKTIRVLPPVIVATNVTMTCTGAGFDAARTAQEISGYLTTFLPGQTLFRSQLINIAVMQGAEDVTLTLPAANVAATGTEIIRPGVISVA